MQDFLQLLGESFHDLPYYLAMPNHTTYTRAYSSSRSDGQLVARKTPKGDPLSSSTLLEEFRNHANKGNRKPTALVSVSDRIIDTVKRAFERYGKGEDSGKIWIAFIEVQTTTAATRIHSARKMAKKCGFPELRLFAHEFVFEWAIPKHCVLHEVSLQTLMDRGLQGNSFLQLATAKSRSSIATRFQRHSPWEIGIELGLFARKFGARAPLNWVSHQLSMIVCGQTL